MGLCGVIAWGRITPELGVHALPSRLVSSREAPVVPVLLEVPLEAPTESWLIAVAGPVLGKRIHSPTRCMTTGAFSSRSREMHDGTDALVALSGGDGI